MRILDLFAGPGGWDEGLGWLGFDALGIERDEAACATAIAAGHERLQADVAALNPRDFGPVDGLIASPPCQSFSNAGRGRGREDKPLVIACAHELAAGFDTRNERLAECADERSMLTVEPLRWALDLRPRWLAFEQVPAVLELWTIFAQLLHAHGYQSAVGTLSAEQYGVPQTRKRAYMIASLDGPVRLPEPTHEPYRKGMARGSSTTLLPWVSMAEALGWSEGIGVQHRRSGPRLEETWSADRPSDTITSRTDRWQAHKIWGLRASVSDNGYRKAQPRELDEPAATVTGKHRSAEWVVDTGNTRSGSRPEGRWRATEEPAPTVTSRADQLEWRDARWIDPPRDASWPENRPATTVAGDPRIAQPGHKKDKGSPNSPRRQEGAIRVTEAEAAVLQGFRSDYPWHGTKTKRFEQIGNAVCPPVAVRVLWAAMVRTVAGPEDVAA